MSAENRVPPVLWTKDSERTLKVWIKKNYKEENTQNRYSKDLVNTEHFWKEQKSEVQAFTLPQESGLTHQTVREATECPKSAVWYLDIWDQNILSSIAQARIRIGPIVLWFTSRCLLRVLLKEWTTFEEEKKLFKTPCLLWLKNPDFQAI